ncbi:hypothetical protein [Trinickia acidisoli]|uniref:hypothetical protein n=1 Tax=Trinickia acidisoli TaxID=2767482 RepID=UPI001A8F0670|nr:hypothetical protein [Trinickia acidisoli]
MKKKIMTAMLLVILQCCCAHVAFSQSSIEAKHHILSVDMGAPGCAIDIADLYGGYLKSGMPKNASYSTDVPPVRSTLERFGINFECQTDQDFIDASHNFGAQWNEGKKRWDLYYEDANDSKILPPVSRIYQLKSRNASGFMRTTDQISGEEDQRVRFYSFCLFHDKAAVCGTGQSMRLEEPKGDYLPFIMRVLRSVNFVDDKKSDPDQ